MNETPPFSDPLIDDFPAPNPNALPASPPADLSSRITDGEKFVVFFLDDELFAVRAARIAEIVRPLDYTPLPNSPAWLHGIANLRGAIVSVLNLSKICRKTGGAADSSKSKLIVLKTANSASPIAFPVDRLSEIVAFHEKDVEPSDDARFFGRAVYKTARVKLLDTDKLFASLV
ncbi:MAG TPA: chemotaxis protein CheW [Pyrinomonadaceae bacterium]|jgi:purine-binding chemotaxis protein CheW